MVDWCCFQARSKHTGWLIAEFYKLLQFVGFISIDRIENSTKDATSHCRCTYYALVSTGMIIQYPAVKREILYTNKITIFCTVKGTDIQDAI